MCWGRAYQAVPLEEVEAVGVEAWRWRHLVLFSKLIEVEAG
jgi:hypothetical protein